MSGNKYKSLIFIFVLGLVLRILFAFYLEDKIYWEDGLVYDGLATRLLEGKGYVNSDSSPTSFRAPGYPFFLFSIYSIFGHRFWAVRIIQALLDSVAVILIHRIAQLIFNLKVARFTAFFYAIYPLFIYTASTFFPTTFFIFLLLLLVFIIFSVEQHPTKLKLFLLGIVLGLSALTVPVALAFIPFALIWLLLSFRGVHSRKIVYASITISSFIVTLSPWLIRNYRIYFLTFIV